MNGRVAPLDCVPIHLLNYYFLCFNLNFIRIAKSLKFSSHNLKVFVYLGQ